MYIADLVHMYNDIVSIQQFEAKRKMKQCSYEGCTNNAKELGVCNSHGAKRKTCSHEGCTSFAKNRGVCVQHGATVAPRKLCSHEGCMKIAVSRGVCNSRGAKVKICSHDGAQLMLSEEDFATNIVMIRAKVTVAMVVRLIHWKNQQQKLRQHLNQIYFLFLFPRYVCQVTLIVCITKIRTKKKKVWIITITKLRNI